MLALSEHSLPEVEEFYTVAEVAKIFKVTNYTIRDWIRSGPFKGKAGKLNGYWRIPRSAVAAHAQSLYGGQD